MQFKMKRLATDDATDEQIAEFIELNGIEVEKGATRATLLALHSSFTDNPWILVPDLPEDINAAMMAQADAVSAPAQQRLEGGIGDNDPTIRVTVSSTSMPGGKHPVPVGVNGRVVVIQRDKSVDLPMRYYYALENAVAAEVSQVEGTNERVETSIKNYPVSVQEWPDKSDVIAWRAKVDDVWMPA